MTLPMSVTQVRPLGCFINSAAGNAYENLPASASGKSPYVSAQGTYASSLYETQLLVTAGGVNAGTALVYVTGMSLVASQNGYLMPDTSWSGAALVAVDTGGAFNTLEGLNVALGGATRMGVLKMPPDAVQPEIVFDQRI
jgi:hypothetical protein